MLLSFAPSNLRHTASLAIFVALIFERMHSHICEGLRVILSSLWRRAGRRQASPRQSRSCKLGIWGTV
jgi:hypothetical protein